VLAVEADEACRDSLRNYLTNEGYEVIAVKNGPEAREVLDRFVPALLIAEVEGEGLPGFELCAFVKTTERLKKVPVLLTTRNGNPTDYSNAHSLGAVVCMAKPYKQERLGHVVRLLAPPPQALAQNTPAPRPPDPSRRTFNGQYTKSAPANGGSRRFRFPSFR
jgi:DNA-binding response OmpR family regulator